MNQNVHYAEIYYVAIWTLVPKGQSNQHNKWHHLRTKHKAFNFLEGHCNARSVFNRVLV